MSLNVIHDQDRMPMFLIDEMSAMAWGRQGASRAEVFKHIDFPRVVGKAAGVGADLRHQIFRSAIESMDSRIESAVDADPSEIRGGGKFGSIQSPGNQLLVGRGHPPEAIRMNWAASQAPYVPSA